MSQATLRDPARRVLEQPSLPPEMVAAITRCGFREKTLPLAFMATAILVAEGAMTLRGLFYRVVSAGWLASTDRAHYDRLGRLMKTLRDKGVVPFPWIVDHVRATIKPSSWSGLPDFADTVRDAYRLDFWAQLPDYVHVFVEKDAMAGVLASVTERFDVPLSVTRGYASVSFAHEIAAGWNQIAKPIFAYYFGDHDPSGLDMERVLREKLDDYCTRDFTWQRLAVLPEDFATFALIPLPLKRSDTRTRRFRALGFTQAAEVDAIPAGAVRDRVDEAIRQHIPAGAWARLQRIETRERRQWRAMLRTFHGNGVRRDGEAEPSA